MLSTTAITAFLGLVATTAIGFPLNDLTSPVELFNREIATSCGISGSISCRNTTAVSNLCCFEHPGGLLVLPQFWDTNPVNGPVDSWTIHGLWPDYCTSGYPQYCDSTRAYSGQIGNYLREQDSATYTYMQKYWVDIDGDPESFWQHEWSKHGTCMRLGDAVSADSTLKTSCMPSGSPKGADAVAYFQAAVKLFKSLPTYTWLANQGIRPSTSATYTRTQLASALKAQSGVTPALDCKSGVVSQVYWYFHLQGSAIDGKYILIDAPRTGNCPSSGIKYTPKAATATTTTAATTTTNVASSLPTKGTVRALVGGTTSTGGLLTAGTWSTQTLATITFTGTPSSFTMTTSKGKCAVSSANNGVLTCGSGVTTPSTFSAVQSGSQVLVAYQGSTMFGSEGTPSGTVVWPVYVGAGWAKGYTLAIVAS